MKTTRRFRNCQRGSLLIVAMILCAVISISLVSYIQLGRNSLQISNRALYNNGAMNLAENGLEEAMYAINKKAVDASYTFPGWAISGANATKTLPSTGTYQFEQGAKGTVQVYIENYLTTAPTVYSRAVVTLGGSSSRTIEKWVRIQLRRTSRFANGLVAKEQIRFSGNNASVDSWDSTAGSSPPTPYSASVRRDNGTVGSISVSTSAILVQNADIWGYAATGNHTAGSGINVGPNGLVGPFGTAAGVKDPNRISADFTANVDSVTAPTTTGYNLGSVTAGIELPRPSIGGNPADTPATDGKYYYTVSEISFNNATLAIKKRASITGDPSPQVIIKVTNTNNSITIGGGSGMLSIETGAKLEIWAPGDIKIAGKGIMNGSTSNTTITAAECNQPANLQIYGTKTTQYQNVDIAGNGALSAIVYVPEGDVKINGNGDVMGSVVASKIDLTGNAAFHYDESLGKFGGDNPYRVSIWQELTSQADRSAHASKFTP